MEFYRYDDDHESRCYGFDISDNIRETVFYLIKETPCGYWVSRYKHWAKMNDIVEYRDSIYGKRWVSKNGLRRFCYPTRKEALFNYLKRKEYHLFHLNRKLKTALAGQKYAQEKYNELCREVQTENA